MELLLRPWKTDDAPALQICADDAEVARNLRDVFPHPYTLQDAQNYIAFCREREYAAHQLCYAIAADGALAGSIALTMGTDVYRKSAELGYWLAKSYWGKGLMTRAVAQICKKGFAAFDLVRIYAEPFSRNIASRRVLEKNGFVLEGVLRKSVCKEGRILDSCVYALIQA